jgi:hypothetical protein
MFRTGLLYGFRYSSAMNGNLKHFATLTVLALALVWAGSAAAQQATNSQPPLITNFVVVVIEELEQGIDDIHAQLSSGDLKATTLNSREWFRWLNRIRQPR